MYYVYVEEFVINVISKLHIVTFKMKFVKVLILMFCEFILSK